MPEQLSIKVRASQEQGLKI